MTNARTPQHTKQSQPLGQVKIRPGKLETFSLGLYSHGCPEPVVTLDYKPDLPDAIGVHAFRLEQAGCYELVYQFQNFGQQTCQVTVNAVLSGPRVR